MQLKRTTKKLEVLQYPHPMLEIESDPINFIGRDIVLLSQNMIYTMEELNGMGLSANQVGAPIRMFVMRIYSNDNKAPKNLIAINPSILEKENEVDSMEGCLSFDYISKPVKVKRYNKILLSYADLNASYNVVELTGTFAICAQHEIDHLNGITFVDRTTTKTKQWLLASASKHLEKAWEK